MKAKQYQQQAALMKHGYILKDAQNGARALMAASLCAFPGVRHAFSTRVGGVSAGPYSSMNLCWKRMEAVEEVEENYRHFCAGFGFCYEELATINYEHGATVLPLTCADCGKGFPGFPKLTFCDGLVTNDPGVTLVSSHADCGAFFFFDPVAKACGVAHAGWKGTLRRIGAETVRQMHVLYSSQPKNILVAIGPCISKANFEVDLSLAIRFLEEFGAEDIFSQGRPDKAYLDLEMAAAIQLLEAGIPAENITCMHACTYAKSDLFYSFRRDHGETGSMSGFIKLI